MDMVSIAKYRQPIRRADVGLDVMAVKRALRRMHHFRNMVLGYRAGKAFVQNVKAVQQSHGLHADGVYGPKTHAVVAPHFDGYGVWLYKHARIRQRHGYVNPFAHANVVPGRIDMGVDYHGHGPICAIGACKIVALGGHGWPGGEYLLYRLLTGVHAGRHVYVAEGIVPMVRAGERVGAGGIIAYFRHDAFPGQFPGIETGWGSATANLTWAAITTGYREGQETHAGKAFTRFLHDLGAPVIRYPGPGPTFV